MNIYEYAMQMEQDGEKFYLLLAGTCQVEGLTTIFTMLANEEVKHYKTIAHLQKNAGNSPLVKTTVLENVKNIFIRMKEDKADVRFDSSELESYRKAMAIEEMSWKFYLDKAANADEENVKQIFLRLAGEEEKHLRIMENIVEFVARPEPGNWLENAEWHHLDEY
jgi:rubrerythrin